MDANSMDRKEFFVLTFTLIGSAVAGAAACSSSSNNTDGGGGSGGGSGGGGAGGMTAGNLACVDPLPETQVPDQTGHTHTVTVPEATLNATTDQTFTTSPGGSDGHTHMITLTVAILGTIKAGGQMTVTSTTTDAHDHMFTVSCQAA